MAKSSADKFRAPAEKYVGKIGVLEGTVQLTQWHRPYLKNQHEAYQGQGVDLRPERPAKKPKVPSEVKQNNVDRNKGGG